MPASAIRSRTRTFRRAKGLSPPAEWPRPPRVRRGARGVSGGSHLCALGVHVEGSGDGDAALDVGAEIGESELDRAEGGRDVEDVVVTDVADAEDLPLQVRLSVRELDAVAIAKP